MPNRRFHGKRRFAVFGTFLLIFSSTVAEHYELTVCCSLHGQGHPFHGEAAMIDDTYLTGSWRTSSP